MNSNNSYVLIAYKPSENMAMFKYILGNDINKQNYKTIKLKADFRKCLLPFSSQAFILSSAVQYPRH
jgi:hypothetical protein